MAQELLRLFAHLVSMRPILESIYHRMLLYPLVHYRLDAIKAVSEVNDSITSSSFLIVHSVNFQIFKSTQLTVKLITPLSESSLSGKDLALFKM